jgi:hypothetical protein
MANYTFGGPSAPSIPHVGCLDASAVQDVQDSLSQGRQTVLTGTTDPIPFPGVVQLNGASAEVNAPLATPVAGPQPYTGDDGKTVTIYDNSGKAHTIQTAANKIINSKRTLTFNGTIGSNITLMAQGGVWVPVGTPSGVTIS